MFGGNCYSEQWKNEAEKRGLPNLVNTADCLPLINSKKCIDLCSKYGVFTKTEADSRHEIYAENYVKTIRIEAASALEVAGTMILQASLNYKKNLVQAATTPLQKEILQELDTLLDTLIEQLRKLKKAMNELPENGDVQKSADYCCHVIMPTLEALRVTVDSLEEAVDDELWPLPTYTEMLFSR